MLPPIRQAVAVAILNPRGEVLFVRRSEEEMEFPNCWSLPAKTFGPDQSILEVALWTARHKAGVEVSRLHWVNSDVDHRDLHRLRQILHPGVDPKAVEEYRLLMHVVEARLESELPPRLPRFPEYQWRDVDQFYTYELAHTLYRSGQMGDCVRVYLEWRWDISLKE